MRQRKKKRAIGGKRKRVGRVGGVQGKEGSEGRVRKEERMEEVRCKGRKKRSNKELNRR